MKAINTTMKMFAAASVLAVCVIGPVSAGDGPFCGTEFTNLQTSITTADFLNSKDRTNVSNRATQAQAKANLHKCDDALDKLAAIDAKVDFISDPDQTKKVKLSEAGAESIMWETGLTAACVGEIVPCIVNGRP